MAPMSARLPAVSACIALSLLSLTACLGPERAPEPFPSDDPLPGTAHDRSTLALDGELFVGYGNHAYTLGDTRQRQDAFFVDRAELGAGYLAASGLGTELRLEAAQSTFDGPEGIGGFGAGYGGYTMHVRRARGFWTGDAGPVGLDVELGIITDPWLDALLPRFHLRATGPLLTETRGIFDAEELGARIGVRLWHDQIELVVGVLNGEGYARTEQNDSKDLSVRLTIEIPVAEVDGAPLAVGLHGIFRRGRVGPGDAPAENDRYGGALTLGHPDYGLGAMWVKAAGYAGQSDDEAEVFELWADARLIAQWLGVAVRGGQIEHAPAAGETTTRQHLGGGLFADLDALLPGLARSRLYLLYDSTALDTGSPETAEEGQGVRLVFEVAGGRRF
jgi:hypothetical protein